MQPALKTRLLGAAVLIAIAVIVIPLFFSGNPGGGGNRNISLDIPQTPDAALKTRTMSVASTAAPARSSAAPGHKLATVNIPSRVPAEVGTDASAEAPAAAIANASGDSAQTQPVTEKPETSDPGNAAVASYQVNLGAYADKSNAEKLVAKVRKLGYPVTANATRIKGKAAARVDVGPFDSRAAAENARLKLRAALPHAPATLVSAPRNQHGNAPAKAAPAKRAGGWAVQVIAYSKRADANALRDKLRKAGFDSYVDDVKSGGHTLWRVRIGPQTQRDDALSIAKRLHQKFSRLKGVVVTVP
jgi:cell division septation protein DedD